MEKRRAVPSPILMHQSGDFDQSNGDGGMMTKKLGYDDR
jgi:hypothetical protein